MRVVRPAARTREPTPSAQRDRAGGSGPELLLDHVTVGYGTQPAVLHDLVLEARPGEVTGLIGPNGAGKTTVIRVASRALRPWKGGVFIGGKDPYAMSARRAARAVSVVPQEIPWTFSYSALEMVLMGRAPYHSPWGGSTMDDWDAVRRAMAATGATHLHDRPFEELSGGERQAVILAQALAQDAPVLLLDEPTTHLDLRHVVDILAIVRSMARSEGKTVLAIFHDLNLASAYCDRIHALFGGSVAAVGTPGEVITGKTLREIFGIDADVISSGSPGRPAVVMRPPPD
ncbi:MAG: ABC transporter ATP-binding protein [Actinomycetota bacterium]|nr:ABC transporter ATP-binding protein [Actinomycetota bacterium]